MVMLAGSGPDFVATDPHVWDLARNSFYLPHLHLHYLATPKAACTSWKWWVAALLELSPPQDNSHWACLEASPDLMVHQWIGAAAPLVQNFDLQALSRACSDPQVYRFALVRNPFTRIFSAWSSKILLQERGQIPDDLCAAAQALPKTDGEVAAAFEAFVEDISLRDLQQGWRNVHWMPQSLWLDFFQTHYDAIFPLEDMAKAQNEVAQRLAAQGRNFPPLGHFHETVLPYQRRFLTARTIQLIQELYAEDFARFAYDPEQVPMGSDLAPAYIEGILSTVPQVRARHERISQMHRAFQNEYNAHQELQKCYFPLLSKNKNLQKEFDDLLARFQHQTAEFDTVRMQLTELTSSRSWRWTAPIRHLRARLRRQ